MGKGHLWHNIIFKYIKLVRDPRKHPHLPTNLLAKSTKLADNNRSKWTQDSEFVSIGEKHHHNTIQVSVNWEKSTKINKHQLKSTKMNPRLRIVINEIDRDRQLATFPTHIETQATDVFVRWKETSHGQDEVHLTRPQGDPEVPERCDECEWYTDIYDIYQQILLCINICTYIYIYI